MAASAPEGEQQQKERHGQDPQLRGARVGGAGDAQVEVQGHFAGPPEPHLRVRRAQLRAQAVRRFTEARQEVLDGAAAGVQAHDDEKAAVLAREEGVACVQVGQRSSDAGDLAQCAHDRLEGLPPFGNARHGDPFDHEEHPVSKRRSKPALEVVVDGLSLLGRHSRRDFEPVLDLSCSRDEEGGDRQPEKDDEPRMSDDDFGPAGEKRPKGSRARGFSHGRVRTRVSVSFGRRSWHGPPGSRPTIFSPGGRPYQCWGTRSSFSVS